MRIGRPLAYASEVGESFRPLVNVYLVRFLYTVSWGYVFLDTLSKTYVVKDQGRSKMLWYSMDTLVWHCFASMLLPAATIHSAVKYSGKLLYKFIDPKASKFARFGPTCFGLAIIPFIIHPLDHFTDFAMDNSLRKTYVDRLPILPKTH